MPNSHIDHQKVTLHYCCNKRTTFNPYEGHSQESENFKIEIQILKIVLCLLDSKTMFLFSPYVLLLSFFNLSQYNEDIVKVHSSHDFLLYNKRPDI